MKLGDSTKNACMTLSRISERANKTEPNLGNHAWFILSQPSRLEKESKEFLFPLLKCILTYRISLGDVYLVALRQQSWLLLVAV